MSASPDAPAADPPAVREVAPGIHRIAGTRRAAHAYLLRGTRRVALVDCGLPGMEDHLAGCLAQIGLVPADIELLVLTHEHIDHSGGAAPLAAHALVAAHPQAANKLRLADEFALMSRAFAVGAVAPLEVDVLLADGSAIDVGGIALQVVHTPGHCSGSVCLYEPARRLLLSGDTIMARGVVGGVLHSGNTSDYIASLERLLTLRIDTLLPGHGSVSHDAEADIRLGIARLKGLLDDSHTLFLALRDTREGFDDVMRSLRELNVL